MKITACELARRIDHTLLAPEATPEQIDTLCDDALEYGFGAVCVNPVYIRRAVRRLDSSRGSQAPRAPAEAPDPGVAIPGQRARGLPPVVVSVAGFPLGATATATKVYEAQRALDDGAVEIDMVAPLGALIAGDQRRVRADIQAVADAVHKAAQGGILKVILETAALTGEQIIFGCRCCAEGEADFVKTSTGFHRAGGATLEHVRLLYRCASPLLVKAAGGIRTAAAARAMLEAGAARLGTSSGVAMVEELRREAP